MAKTQGTGRQTSGTAAAAPASSAARPKAGATKTYRALSRGYLSTEGRLVEEGEVFATTEPKGSWMEPVKGGNSYGVDEAVDDAQAPHPDDPNLEGLDEAALQAMATERGVTDAGSLSKADLITAIKGARRNDAQ